MKTSESIYLDIRGLRYHVRSWGRQGAPKLFMLHGWMDASASFQFFVDALKGDWHVLAPDLRGYGQTQRQGSDTYWFPDYVVDLDCILEHFQPESPVNLVAHSFGGNIACIYSGSRPQRIARLVNIDAFGPRAEGVKPARLEFKEQAPAEETQVEVPPKRHAEWLDRIKKGSKFRDFDAFADLEKRLAREHPRVTPERIAFIARAWSRVNAQGRVELLADPACASNFSMQFSSRPDDAMACWRAITAPVHMLLARQGGVIERSDDLSDGRMEQRLANLRTADISWVEDCGHMVHLERPEALAARIDAFFPHVHPASPANTAAQPS